jgi:cyclopropane fatty-acyl-phospholipid synthase-like methyltransferase
MPNPVSVLIEKYAGANLLLRMRQYIFGLAEDFWKDGTDNPFKRARIFAVGKKSSPIKAEQQSAQPAVAASQKPQWHAEPGEISEKMWGEGFVAPGTTVIADALIKPLALNKDMSMLDLSAGLGGRMRSAVEQYGIYVTGLEPDAGIAARGMALSVKAGKGKQAAIDAYDPNNFSVTKKYDCFVARETFYRVIDKNKLFNAIGAIAKPRGQISFTDYIVNPEDREKAGIVSWRSFEKDAAPLSLVEMAEAWAKAGFTIRVHEDQTDFYRKEVTAGLARFAKFLATGVQPDAETKKAILRRMQTWVHRMAALEQGMKFYRFYGTK